MTSQNLKMKIRLALLATAVAGGVIGCAVTNTEVRFPLAGQPGEIVPNAGLAGCVILPASTVAASWGFSRDFTPSWNPTTNDVTEALSRLPGYLQQAGSRPLAHPEYSQHLPHLLEWFPQTYCQAVGVRHYGGRAILLNFVPSDFSANQDWKERYIVFFDGGPDWWRVVYLPGSRKFTRFHIDLGF
jgi:hypothetical protein